MPRSGVNGTYSLPSNTNNQAPNTPISSSMFNAFASDVQQTFNDPTPVAYGGTGQSELVLSSSDFGVKDGLDGTKRVSFDLSGITTGTTRTLAVPDKDGTIALTSDLVADLWALQPIGVPIPIMDDIDGVPTPPTDQSYRYVKLTASDAYNTGVLTGESVSGSAPLVIASANVSLAGSPLNGKTISLINTERRFLRAGSAGTVQEDALQEHRHVGDWFRPTGASQYAQGGSSYGLTGMGDVTGARTADETRPKNIGVTYYMRIK